MVLLQRILPVLVLVAAAGAQSGSPAGAIVPGRYIVTYAPGVAMNAPPGARLVSRHSRLGLAVMEARSAAALAGPGVQMVVADRVVAAQALAVRPDYDPAYHAEQGWAVRQVGGYGAVLPIRCGLGRGT